MLPQYTLELPINQKDAHRRKLPVEISKLVISFEKKKQKGVDVFSFFSVLLGKFLLKQEKLCAQPVGSYEHLDKYETMLQQKTFRYWMDTKYRQGKTKKPSLLTVECDSIDKIRSILEMFWSEAIVFFPTKHDQTCGQLEEVLLKRSFGHGYEVEYLKKIEIYGWVAFFAEDHLSLEILGYRERIVSPFFSILEEENEIFIGGKEGS